MLTLTTYPTPSRYLPFLKPGNLLLAVPYYAPCPANQWLYDLLNNPAYTLVDSTTQFTWRDNLVILGDIPNPSYGYQGIPGDSLYSWWLHNYSHPIDQALKANCMISVGLGPCIEYQCYKQLLTTNQTHHLEHESSHYRCIPKARVITKPIPAPFLAA